MLDLARKKCKDLETGKRGDCPFKGKSGISCGDYLTQ